MNSRNTATRFQTAKPAAATLKVPEAFLRREIKRGAVPGFHSGASTRPRFYIDTAKYAEMLEQRIEAAAVNAR